MFQRKVLDNGIRIIAEKIDSIRSVSFGVWIGTGSRNEASKVNGISHFIEHMMFKGTENYTSREIAQRIENIGGQLNAFTSKESTCYYTRTLDSHLEIAMDTLSDMMLRSVFTEQEIQKERGVVIEEINMYEDSPEELVHDLFQMKVWGDNPLAAPILGTADILNNLGQKEIKEYISARYVPENVVIAVAGNFEYEDLYQKIEKYFGTWKKDSRKDEPEQKAIFHPGITVKRKEVEQVHMCVGVPGLALGDRFIYPLIVVNTVLGGGMSSRLFQSIREERGLAYSVYSYLSHYTDAGLLAIYAGMNANQLQEANKVILEEIKLMKEQKLTEDEILKTKEQLKGSYMLGLESTSSRMNSLGKSELLTGKVRTPDEVLKELDAITKEDVDAVIDQVFDLDKVCISVVGKNVEENQIKLSV